MTRTASPTRTATITRTGTRTTTSTPLPTFTGTRTGTRTATVTRTGTPTRTSTRTATESRTPTATRTATGTNTATGTPLDTPSRTATRTASPTPTLSAAFLNVDLLDDLRGDNDDGTFTSIVSAFVTDFRGNPLGDGTEVRFSLRSVGAGVSITAAGLTNEPADCDTGTYTNDTGQEVNPQPGFAFACLRFIGDRAGDVVTVIAEVSRPGPTLSAERDVRLPRGPTPTVTRTNTPVDTPTRTQTATASRTASITPTATETGTATVTSTVTPTETPSPLPTVTDTPGAEIRVAVSDGAGRPGGEAEVDISMVDMRNAVYGLQFDLLFQQGVFTLTQIGQRCRADPRLEKHLVSVTVAFDPNVPPGTQRFRFVVFDTIGDQDLVGTGGLVQCRLPVLSSAPLGLTPVTLDRVLALDELGTLIDGVLEVSGHVLIDPDAPLPTNTPTITPTFTASETPSHTPTRTPTDTPSPTSTSTASPSATATTTSSVTPTAIDTATATTTETASPSPTPTAAPLPCAGDCDGDGTVSVAELIQAVNIALGRAPIASCENLDANDDGRIGVEELIAAVSLSVSECPRGSEAGDEEPTL